MKELYYYLDNMPKHTYMKALYKYPQEPFPYETLINHNRTTMDPEFEILDTGMLHGIWFYNCTNLARYRCAAWDLVLYLYKFSKIQVCCMGFGSIIVQI